eukprot:4276711-Prymnesium_polylepis.1
MRVERGARRSSGLPIVRRLAIIVLPRPVRLPLPPLVHVRAVKVALGAREEGIDDLRALLARVRLGVLKVTAAQPRCVAADAHGRDAVLLAPDV